MTDEHDSQTTQLTQPKGIDPKTGKPYKPVEIPVPKREDWENLLSRAAKPLPGDRINDEKRDPEGPSSA
jgi:hypothetical protein